MALNSRARSLHLSLFTFSILVPNFFNLINKIVIILGTSNVKLSSLKQKLQPKVKKHRYGDQAPTSNEKKNLNANLFLENNFRIELD